MVVSIVYTDIYLYRGKREGMRFCDQALQRMASVQLTASSISARNLWPSFDGLRPSAAAVSSAAFAPPLPHGGLALRSGDRLVVRAATTAAPKVEPITERSMEVFAHGRGIRMSAHKVRRVIDTIRGCSYEEALMILELMRYRACDPIFKLVTSAAANASANMGWDKASLVISKCEVNEGAKIKRSRALARGRSARIQKPTCHISVGVKTKQ